MEIAAPKLCVACGKPAATVSVGVSSLQACVGCVKRYGKARLDLEADRMLANHFAAHNRPKRKPPKRLGECWHCGGPVLQQPDGAFPLWCMACEAERQSLRHAGSISLEGR